MRSLYPILDIPDHETGPPLVECCEGAHVKQINLSALDAPSANALWQRVKDVVRTGVGTVEDRAFADLIAGEFIPLMKSQFGKDCQVLVERETYNRFMGVKQ